jgi:hypothetical protein
MGSVKKNKKNRWYIWVANFWKLTFQGFFFCIIFLSSFVAASLVLANKIVKTFLLRNEVFLMNYIFLVGDRQGRAVHDFLLNVISGRL